MQQKKSYYELLVELALQFVENANLNSHSTLPLLYIETNKGRQGICKVERTATQYMFHVLDGYYAYEAHCQFHNLTHKNADSRLIEKSKVRQAQVILKIAQHNEFYSNNLTVYLNDNLACGLFVRQCGHELVNLSSVEDFNFLILGLESFLKAVNPLKAVACHDDNNQTIYQLEPSTQQVIPYHLLPPVQTKLFCLNDILVYQIQKLPQKEEIWEGAQYYLFDQYVTPSTTNQTYPFTTIIVSKRTKKQILIEISETEEFIEELLTHFLQQIKLVGYRPTQLIVDDTAMLHVFNPLCVALDILCASGDVEEMLKQSGHKVLAETTFDLTMFYEETKEYCEWGLEQLQLKENKEQESRFINHLTIFRFQMFIYTSKFELHWTPSSVEVVLTLLITRFDNQSERKQFLSDVLVYLMELKHHIFIPYADQFKVIIEKRLKQECYQTIEYSTLS